MKKENIRTMKVKKLTASLCLPRRIQSNNKFISKKRHCLIVILGVLAIAILFAIPLSAAEKAKIKLPDGLYMYDSAISKREDGRDWVGFRTFFVVQNNIIYSSQAALRKFGVSKLNKLFTENKKYKILFGGEKIGEIYNVKIGKLNNELDWGYEEELFKKNINQGPAYGRKSIYLGRLGSAVNYIAVPEEYKEVPRKVYKTISKKEVEKISKLAGDKLFNLVINRKEVKKYKIKGKDLVKEGIVLLDKISDRNEEIYIGIYSYEFNVAANVCHAYKFVTCVPVFRIIFAVRKDNVHVITSDYDETTLWNAETTILGRLDFDGCGEDELIIEKDFSGEDETLIHLEIYKQNDDGDWTLIQKNKWEEKR